MGRKKIVRKMRKLHDKWAGGPITSSSKKANTVYRDPNHPRFPSYYLLGVLFDGYGGGDAKRAWTSPHILRKRLGHLDWSIIASMNVDELAEAILGTHSSDGHGALFRFYNNMAKYLQSVAATIQSEYSGDPSQIWKDKSSGGTIVRCFWALPGIAQKRATMAANILHREYAQPMTTHDIDVSVDIQIMRVFVRTGLSQTRKKQDIIEAARHYAPDYPGVLDLPAWNIGRYWCRPNTPFCDDDDEPCPLSRICPRNPINF